MRVRIFPLPLAFILAAPLMAGTVYTYTGNNFTSASGPSLNTLDSIAGSFTVNSPLANNLSGATITPTSFSFSDGLQTFAGSDPLIGLCSCSPFFGNISTDASGNIVNWQVSLTLGRLGSASLTTVDANLGIFVGLKIQDSANANSSGNDTASNSGSPGRWTQGTTSAAPEPASFVLLGSVLAGMALVIRLRLQRS